jgi:hypothetical protein
MRQSTEARRHFPGVSFCWEDTGPPQADGFVQAHQLEFRRSDHMSARVGPHSACFPMTVSSGAGSVLHRRVVSPAGNQVLSSPQVLLSCSCVIPYTSFRFVRGRSASLRFATGRSELDRLASFRCAPLRFALNRVTCPKFVLNRTVWLRFDHLGCDPDKSASLRIVPLRSAAVRFASRSSTPSKDAQEGSSLGSLGEPLSALDRSMPTSGMRALSGMRHPYSHRTQIAPSSLFRYWSASILPLLPGA